MALPYTLTTAETEIRRILQEPVALSLSQAEIQDFLNSGVRVMSALTLCNMETEKVAISENQMKVDTTKVYIKIEDVVFDTVQSGGGGPIGLQRVSIKAIGHCGIGSPGLPRFYSVWCNDASGYEPSLYIWPIYTPTSIEYISVTGYTCLTSYSETTCPYYLQYPVIYYALSSCMAKLGKHPQSAMYMQKFLADCGFYRREIYDWRKSVDSKDMAKVPDLTRFATTG